MNWLDLVKFLAPIILVKINPHLAQVSDSIIKGISEASQMSNASGEDKLKHAVNITNDAVNAINSATGIQRIDPVVVSDSAAHAISLIVDITKLIHKSPININN